MLPEGRFFPKAEFFEVFSKLANCGFNTRHDNREVKLIEFLDSRICPLSEYLPNVPKFPNSEVWISEVWIEHTTW